MEPNVQAAIFEETKSKSAFIELLEVPLSAKTETAIECRKSRDDVYLKELRNNGCGGSADDTWYTRTITNRGKAVRDLSNNHFANLRLQWLGLIRLGDDVYGNPNGTISYTKTTSRIRSFFRMADFLVSARTVHVAFVNIKDITFHHMRIEVNMRKIRAWLRTTDLKSPAAQVAAARVWYTIEWVVNVALGYPKDGTVRPLGYLASYVALLKNVVTSPSIRGSEKEVQNKLAKVVATFTFMSTAPLFYGRVDVSNAFSAFKDAVKRLDDLTTSGVQKRQANKTDIQIARAQLPFFGELMYRTLLSENENTILAERMHYTYIIWANNIHTIINMQLLIPIPMNVNVDFLTMLEREVPNPNQDLLVHVKNAATKSNYLDHSDVGLLNFANDALQSRLVRSRNNIYKRLAVASRDRFPDNPRFAKYKLSYLTFLNSFLAHTAKHPESEPVALDFSAYGFTDDALPKGDGMQYFDDDGMLSDTAIVQWLLTWDEMNSTRKVMNNSFLGGAGWYTSQRIKAFSGAGVSNITLGGPSGTPIPVTSLTAQPAPKLLKVEGVEVEDEEYHEEEGVENVAGGEDDVMTFDDIDGLDMFLPGDDYSQGY